MQGKDTSFFRLLADNSPLFIGMCDMNLRPFYGNDAGRRLVGIDNLQHFSETPVTAFFFPEDQDFILNEFFPQVFKEGRAETEIRFRHFKTGEAIWMIYDVFVLKDESGKAVGLATLSRDITERKNAEQREKRRASELQAILDTAPLGVSIALDPSGERIEGNRALEEMFGVAFKGEFSKRGAKPAAYRLFRDGRELPTPELPMQRALRGETVEGQVLDVVRADGLALTAFAKATSLRDDKGQICGAVGAFLDVTRLKQAEDALREADRRKDEFIAMLAHELRNPLAPLKTGLALLRSGVDRAKAARLHDTMARQVDHLVRLVDDLLEVARFSRGLIELRRESIDLAQVVDDAVAASQPLMAERQNALTRSLAPEPLPLDADPTRLAQVLTNLLNNAAKFTPSGGRIEIATRREAGDAVVSVRDNGAGIPSEKLGCIFELFTQLDSGDASHGGGLGIGLAMVRKLVEMHGGRVEVFSEGLGRGSEFIVRLPLAQTNAPRVEPTASAPAHVARRRILVVDDSRDIADVLVMLLETLDEDVRVAYDGQSALELVAAFKPEIVFLDIGMPEMDGYETARRIRQLPEGKRMFLIALTGWGQEQDRRRTREAGFDEHLVKPVNFEQVQALLAERSAESAGASSVSQG
ncbi:response regulator [Rhodoblastus acidophilus]|uniref:histidine kinase n=1 Tax=Rhodoblastus acidophilus TaxID=1074 RepID=A0A6N8DRA7_RHOAC|nr:PAS domain-containing sensor histidine kinase [Rhodoblastus acidophilus]MCW2275083.1 PAS domain S-box-containing protein [Rhodoblastus acidophilus]MTV31354.1 response regulator [Rhodoblastus acidophilus]